MRGFHPRAVDLLDTVRRDLRDYVPGTGIREGLSAVGEGAMAALLVHSFLAAA